MAFLFRDGTDGQTERRTDGTGVMLSAAPEEVRIITW